MCLFSGGVDSLAVLFNGTGYSHRIALFVAHSDQSGTVNIVRRLYSSVLKQYEIPLLSVYAPPIRRLGYSQSRGFLYGMAGIAVALNLGAKSLLFGECGPTMFQPRFGPFDATTMTSHPVVINTLRSIGKKLSGGGLSLQTPLSNTTKAEAIALLRDPAWLRLTHSCISQQFRRHDGTCYGCIIRRLGSAVAGVPDVDYRYHLLDAGRRGKDNLLSLLRFSHDILFDFESLPERRLKKSSTGGPGPYSSASRWII